MHNFINPDDSYFKAIHGKGSRNLNTGILTRDLLYHFFQVCYGQCLVHSSIYICLLYCVLISRRSICRM